MTEGREQLIARYQVMYLDGGIDGVAFVAADSTRCDACARYDGQMYTPSTLPVIPVPDCTRSTGCRCRYEANITTAE